MNQKISNIHYKKISDLYESGLSTIDISKIYNVTPLCISKILRKNNIKIRSQFTPKNYHKNIDYFSVIDTELKSYFLGFLCADGYNGFYKIALFLQKDDIEIISKFKKEIDFDGPISVIKANQYKNRLNKKDLVGLIISSNKICSDLERAGCINNKSLTLKFPNKNQVPDHLMNHFIRGYFDGDGCAHNSKHNGIVATITSSKFFIKSLIKYFKKLLNINFFYQSNKNNKSKTAYLGGFNQVKAFYDYLYSNASFFLKRKKETFIQGFKIRLEKETKRIQKKSSKYIGVSWHKRKNKWESFISINKKTKSLGDFENEKDAALAYDYAAAKIKNKQLNFNRSLTNPNIIDKIESVIK